MNTARTKSRQWKHLQMGHHILVFLASLLICQANGALASGSNALDSVCDEAAAIASRTEGVPVSVLAAIARVETGRSRQGQFTPWPWTINVAGRGYWFETRAQAEREIRKLVSEGTANFDVGCFQINRRWHGDAFPNAVAMLDPVANATYAAKFLGQLFSTTAAWTEAAGRYHSRTPERAAAYRSRFAQIHAALDFGPSSASDSQAPQNRVNTYPLLTGEQAIPLTAGSLFPSRVSGDRRTSLIGG